LHHLLLAEARQAQLTRLRLLRREGQIERRRGAASTPTRRALVIDEAWPRIDRDAGSQAIISHMGALQRRRWHVSFTATSALGDDAIAKATLESLGITCHAAPEVGSVEELLRDAADQYQLVYLHRLSVASAYAGLVRRYQPRARLIYSVADLHHLRLARQAAVEARPELARRAAVLRRQELLAVQQADAVITHSPVEAGLLAREAPGVQVQVVPWMVRPGPSPRPWRQRQGIVLVANFAHEPNADGLLWLAREVMPLVWSNAPEVTLTVAGTGLASGIVRTLTDRRLKLLGHVPGLRPLLASARLAVAPLRYGAGIKGKVVEAWAAGLPCAMTPIAAEGLPLDATLADTVAADAQSLAQLILALHLDPTHNAAVSRAGRATVRWHFSQKQVDNALAAALVRPAASVHAIRAAA
jgi:glycosyltransferase involved in cell wall biosynthesis